LQQADLKPQEVAAIYAARGRAWLREEEPEEAVSDFTRALEFKPADPALLPVLLKDRARAHTRLAAHKQAAEDWSALIALDPAAEPAYLNRAQTLLAAGDTAAALADFDTVLARNARSVEARIGRGNVFVALDQKADAYREFDLAQETAPGDWQVYHARGVAADKWGDTKLAIENYTRTLHLNNVNWDARRALRRLGLVNIP
jgi:tetratricopeptide (TPR) repeat protein